MLPMFLSILLPENEFPASRNDDMAHVWNDAIPKQSSAGVTATKDRFKIAEPGSYLKHSKHNKKQIEINEMTR